MAIVTPESGAISRYLWDTAQENIKGILEDISSAQALINQDYAFTVTSDKYSPTIEELVSNNHLVNIYVATVVSDGHETNFSKNHIVTYNIDCYVQGLNEDDTITNILVPADEVAVARLKYQCAMVEYGLTKLSNFYMDLNSGEIIPDKLDLVFGTVEDAAESFTPYAPARFRFVCKFPYTPQDLENLPDLDEFKVDLDVWASEYLK